MKNELIFSKINFFTGKWNFKLNFSAGSRGGNGRMASTTGTLKHNLNLFYNSAESDQARQPPNLQQTCFNRPETVKAKLMKTHENV